MSIEAILPAETAGREAERIAQGLRRGDLTVLNRLVDRYQDRLVRYLIHLLGRQEHVEDLVQATWLRVLERGRQYDCRWRFEAWLFTIARNLALDLPSLCAALLLLTPRSLAEHREEVLAS